MVTATRLATWVSGLICATAASVGQRQQSPAPAIAFASHRDGNWEIYTTDDRGNETRLTRRDGHTRFPLWSPDRSQIAFATQRSEPGDGWDFWVMEADGKNQRRLCSGLSGNHIVSGRVMGAVSH